MKAKMAFVWPLLSITNTEEHVCIFAHIRYKSTRIITTLGHYLVIQYVLFTVMKYYHWTRAIIAWIEWNLPKSWVEIKNK